MSRRRNLLAIVSLLALALGVTALSGAFGAAVSAADGGSGTLSAGCGKAPSLTSGMRSIQSRGGNRNYILTVPDNYDNNHPYRLIFGFHWVGGTANDVASGGTDRDLWAYYGLKQLSNNSTIFVAPQGINNGWGNGGGGDVALVDDIISEVEKSLCVDTGQLFSVGFSYGGSMSYAIACARPTVFRAVAVYAGGQLSGCDGGTQPIAYLGIHGTNDGVLGIGLGRGLRDRFVKNNGCTAQETPEPSRGSLKHIVTDYSGCRPGYPVQWAAFDGGHTPGPIDGGGDGGRTWTKEVVWKFFTQFQSAPQPGQPAPQPSQPAPQPSQPTPAAPGSSNGSPSCTATYRQGAAWPGGYLGTVTVGNKGGGSLSRWSVGLTLSQGQRMVAVWNGKSTGTSGDVTVASLSHNGTIGAGGSQVFGFVVSGNASTGVTGVTCSSS
jgi:poly(3-hydroxybutyrate) depolymerase